MKDRVNVACGCYLCDPVARKRDHRDRIEREIDKQAASDNPTSGAPGGTKDG